MIQPIKAREIAAEIALGLVTGRVLPSKNRSLGDELADVDTSQLADTGSLDDEMELALLEVAHQNGSGRVRKDVERITALRTSNEAQSAPASKTPSRTIVATTATTGIGALISAIVSGITAILGATVIAAGAVAFAAAVAMIASLF